MCDIAIVIVNYNTRHLLAECLASVNHSRGDVSWEVWVVDNASTDGSADAVAADVPGAHLIRSETNGGYPYANNLGLRAVLDSDSPPPPYVLLLNPDTLLGHSALADMLTFMERHPDAGAAGPRLVRANGELDLACRRSFPTPISSFYRISGLSRLFPRSPRFAHYNLTFLMPDVTTEVDSVAGSFMMVRTEAIQQVGLLDEDFFMYGEDLDWAYRMKAAGWKVYYNADVTVLHYKGESSKSSRKARYEFYRAMYVFYQKHYRSTTPVWLHSLVVGGIALRGGLAMLRELTRPRGNVPGTRRSHRTVTSTAPSAGVLPEHSAEAVPQRDAPARPLEEFRDD
jgi:N-acetylglucosaminyl-diphospho-decaprenol L-rhamnosyltransferase